MPNSRIDSYFLSIQDAFKRSLAAEDQENWWLIEIAGYFALGCGVPVVPFGCWALFHYTRLRSLLDHHAYLRTHGFGTWWFCFVAGAILFLAATRKVNSKRQMRAKKRVLEEAALRFAYCYALVRRIRAYRETKLDESYVDVPKLFVKLQNSIAHFLNPFRRVPDDDQDELHCSF